jgi:hypothetical protein
MDIHWYCYRFDYAQYLRLRPALRAATTPAALEAVAGGRDADAIIEAFTAEEILLTEARASLVELLCCVGEPLPFDYGLPRIVAGLERATGMEEAAHLLSGLLSGGRNMEPWLLPSSGLTGFLTPQEATALHVSYVAWRSTNHGRRRKTRRRQPQGGIQKCIVLLQNLLAGGPQPDEIHRLLGQLLEEAARTDCGIAAVSVQSS